MRRGDIACAELELTSHAEELGELQAIADLAQQRLGLRQRLAGLGEAGLQEMKLCDAGQEAAFEALIADGAHEPERLLVVVGAFSVSPSLWCRLPR